MGVSDLCLGVTASLPGIKAEPEQTLLEKITLFLLLTHNEDQGSDFLCQSCYVFSQLQTV